MCVCVSASVTFFSLNFICLLTKIHIYTHIYIYRACFDYLGLSYAEVSMFFLNKDSCGEGIDVVNGTYRSHTHTHIIIIHTQTHTHTYTYTYTHN